MENEGHALLYVPVGKPQQVSRSHCNTMSLMHAGPVETTEWAPLVETQTNSTKGCAAYQGGQVESLQKCTR